MTQKKGNKPFQLNSLDLSNIIEYPFVRSILPIKNTVDLHVISIKSKDIFNTGKKRSFYYHYSLPGDIAYVDRKGEKRCCSDDHIFPSGILDRYSGRKNLYRILPKDLVSCSLLSY